MANVTVTDFGDVAEISDGPFVDNFSAHVALTPAVRSINRKQFDWPNNLYQHNCTAKVIGTAQVATRFAHIMVGTLHRQSHAEEYTNGSSAK